MDKTTVEQFAIALYEGGYLQGNGDKIQKLLEQHLEMEKKQIINAFEQGENNSVDYFNPENRIKESEQFYNETYGGKNENQS
jgi:hypothetical protein